MGGGGESGRRLEGVERVDDARYHSLVRGPALDTVGRKLPGLRGKRVAGPCAAQVRRLGRRMAVVLQRGCRHGGMRLHDVRIHVLLRLSANLLHAMGGWIGLYAVMRRQRVTAAVFAASPVAESLAFMLCCSYGRACRGCA